MKNVVSWLLASVLSCAAFSFASIPTPVFTLVEGIDFSQLSMAALSIGILIAGLFVVRQALKVLLRMIARDTQAEIDSWGLRK
jgi:uncharacterized RDD family membrane protein YckC